MADEKLNDLPKIKGSFKKKGLGSDVGKYVLDEYIVPKSKDLVHDTLASILDIFTDSLQGALNKTIYGEDKPRKKKNGTTNYSSFSEAIAARSRSSEGRTSLNRRSSTQVMDIWVETEDEAREIVGRMHDYIDRYGQAKVSDLYQMMDPPLPIIFTDYQFGWTDEADITYQKERTGDHRGEFLIVTAEPVKIKM
jgi:hypothetical protein